MKYKIKIKKNGEADLRNIDLEKLDWEKLSSKEVIAILHSLHFNPGYPTNAVKLVKSLR